MPEPRVKLLLIATHPYSAMLDACAVITALMKRPGNNFQLTVGRWKFNFIPSPLRNINPVSSITKKYRGRIVNTLFKVKLQVTAIQLVVSLERNVRYALFSCSSRFGKSRQQSFLGKHIQIRGK